MTDTKIETGIRYVGQALAEIVKLLLPGDRVRVEFNHDFVVEGLAQKPSPSGNVFGDALWIGSVAIRRNDGGSFSDVEAITVLSLAPRPDQEPWWAGADAVMDKDGAVWQYDRKVDLYDRWGEASAADDLDRDYGPCTPLRQDGRTILSEEEIGAVISEVILHGRKVGHVLIERHGWRKGEK